MTGKPVARYHAMVIVGALAVARIPRIIDGLRELRNREHQV